MMLLVKFSMEIRNFGFQQIMNNDSVPWISFHLYHLMVKISVFFLLIGQIWNREITPTGELNTEIDTFELFTVGK